MTIDHLRTAIAEQVPRLQSWEVDGLAKKLEREGLLITPGYIGEIDAGDWELSTIRLDVDRQMFKDGKVKMGAKVLIVPKEPS